MLLEKIVNKWSDIGIYAMKLVLENYGFLVYMYYNMPPGVCKLCVVYSNFYGIHCSLESL